MVLIFKDADFLKLFLYLCLSLTDAASYLEGLKGIIGAGNYTYYKLSSPGNIRIVLNSLNGDADLYISQSNQQPTFEDYDLKSTTCATDEVNIPMTFKRPVWLGVYGYISTETTSYQILIYRLAEEDYQLDFIPDSTNEESSAYTDKVHIPKISNHKVASDDGDSILWNIIVGFLKIILEVLL